MAPRSAKMYKKKAPRWSQDGAKMGQDGAKMAPKSVKMGENGAKVGQDGEDDAKMDSRRAKLSASWTKSGSSRHLEAILKRCCHHRAAVNRLDAFILPSRAVLDCSGTPGAVLSN